MDFERDWLNYLEFIKPFLDVCTDKNVLEIGPLHGYHTSIIEKTNPKSVTLVEPNSDVIEELKNNFPNYNVIKEDIFDFVETPQLFDVVVCFGVLYHFHSPIHLLEKIVNNFNPKIILIESLFLNDDNIARISDEDDNKKGSRIFNGKSAKIHIVYNTNVIIRAMINLGYELETKEQIPMTNVDSKNNMTLLIFKNK